MLAQECSLFHLIVRLLNGQVSHHELGEVDWKIFAQQLKDNKILTHAYKRLVTIPGLKIPSIVTDYVNKQTALNMILTTESARIISLLKENSIEVLPIKGSSLSEIIYGDKTSRDSGDIDLLIKRNQLILTLSKIAQFGYHPKFKLNSQQLFFESRIGHALELNNIDNGVSLDLHWNIGESYYIPSSFTQYYWNTVTPASANPAILISIAVQAYKEGWQKLGTLYDFYNFINKYPHYESTAAAIAKKFGILPAYMLTMNSTKSIFENCGILPAYSNELLNIVRGQSSITRQTRSLIIRYTLPFGSDWKLFNLPASFFPLYFLLKPLKSGFNFIRQYLFRN